MAISAEEAVGSAEELDILRRCNELLEAHQPALVPPKDFLGAQFEAGLAWVHFPEGYGGLARSRKLQALVNQTLRAAGAPSSMTGNPIGYGMGAPTVLAHGSEAQRLRYLRPLFTVEEVWCQLFSEPGAGSDVAGLATRAERDGDEWVVNGQKVWTSLAHISRWGMLVARTDPEAEKHNGLTYFVVDMKAPGVEVRPLRRLTGDADFNEVFFTDVRIPDTERLSGIGDGWRTAVTTLMNERVSLGSNSAPRGAGPIAVALQLWGRKGQRDPVTRDRLIRLWIDAEVQRLTSLRAAATALLGVPGPEGSTIKLADAESNMAIYEFCVELLGPYGMLYGSYDMHQAQGIEESDLPQKRFLRSRANSIEGGTSEIMRNILAERVLGLPGDVRVDKGIPWSQVNRN